MEVIAMRLWMALAVYVLSLFGGLPRLFLLFLTPEPLAGSTEVWSLAGWQEFVSAGFTVGRLPPLLLWTLLAVIYSLRRKRLVAVSYGVSLLVWIATEYILWRHLLRACLTSEGRVVTDAFRMVNVDVDFCEGLLNQPRFLGILRDFMTLYQSLRLVRYLITKVANLLIKKTTIKTKVPVTLFDYVLNAGDRIMVMCDGILTGGITEIVDGVYASKTDTLKLDIPQDKPRQTLKLLLSSESNIGVTRAILESVKAEHPLRSVNSDAGREVNRLIKTQVYLSNTDGRLSGMGTLVNTNAGLCIQTLGHVIRGCRSSNNSVVVRSATTNAAITLHTLNIRRLTTFKVGDTMDSRVLFRVDANLQARLSLKAAPVSENFKAGHGMVFSPPERDGKAARFSTGLLADLRAGALLTFAGSTLPGTSGAGVFLGGRLISTHVGCLSEGNENISIINLPRGGKPVDKAQRSFWLANQGVRLESASPELKVFELVDFLDTFADDDDEAYQMEDIDLDDEGGRYSRYTVLGSAHREDASNDLLDPYNNSYQETLDSMCNSTRPRWADDDDEDQATLQDAYEAQGRRDAGRTGAHGTTRRRVTFESTTPTDTEYASKTACPVYVVGDDDKDPVSLEIKQIQERIKTLKVLAKAKKTRQGRINDLVNYRSQLKALSESLGLVYDEPVIRLESASPLSDDDSESESEQSDDSSDFGSGERLPQTSTAPATVQLPKSSVVLESVLGETTPPSNPGLPPPPPTSAKAGKKKKAKKNRKTPSSSGGAPALESPVASNVTLAELTKLLAPLTSKFESMERQIAALQPQSAP